MEVIVVLVASLLAFASSKSLVVKDKPFVSIELPFGFQPEGVTAGPPGILFVGSVNAKVPGTVVKIDVARRMIVKTFNVNTPLVAGMWYNRPRKYLVLAATTRVIVLDTITGNTVKKCEIEAAGFLNDIVIYKGNIYVTDSFKQVLHVLSIKKSCDHKTVPLPETDFYPGEFNMNGIAKYEGQLLVSQSTAGKIYQVDPFTFATRVVIDRQPGADGLVVKNSLLYTVKGPYNKIQVVKLSMNAWGEIIAVRIGQIRNKAFRFPSTGAFVNGDICVCNSRFDEFSPFGGVPNATFNVICTSPGF